MFSDVDGVNYIKKQVSSFKTTQFNTKLFFKQCPISDQTGTN